MENNLAKRKIEWFPAAHLYFEYYSYSATVQSYQDDMVQVVGFPFNYKYEDLNVFYDKKNVDDHIKMLLADPVQILQQIQFIKDHILQLHTVSQDVGEGRDLDSLNTFYTTYKEFLPAMGIVLGLEQALQLHLKTFLSEEELYCVAFAEETSATQEYKSVLSLAELLSDATLLDRGIEQHLQKYAWLGSKLLTLRVYTKEDILTRVQSFEKTFTTKKREFVENRKNMEAKLSAILMRLDKKEQKIVQQYRDVLYLRTERADAIARAGYLTRTLFSWVAEQLKMSRDELLRFSQQEILAMMHGQDRLSPDDRKEYHAQIVNGSASVIWGSWQEGNKDVTQEVSSFIGVVASRGYVRGVVRIMMGPHDLKKFSQGDIIVAPYTNVNMVPAMEKASAIVTDIGGLTSHATIVSRELKIPCIIGTKIATKALKDGDFVEVNANEGIVKILKKGE